MRLSRGAMTDRGQAPWRVLPSAMQREQPISLVRSLCTSIKHRVCGRLAWWSSTTRPQASKAARVCGVVRLSGEAMTHRGQAPSDVLPSAMQREQPISLVRSRSASIEHCMSMAGSRGRRRRPGWGSHHGRLLEEALAILPSVM